jgi:pyrroloquinoline quinone (PQQ) biosynthesis protein C
MAIELKTQRAPKAFVDEMTELVNAQFESDGYKRMLGTKFSLKGAQQFFMQHAQFNLNRRDCWGYVQASSPMAVKKLVWEHEEEELGGVPSRGGANHYELAVMQGEAFGLTPEDYYNAPTMDGTLTASYAWINLAKSGDWLEAFSASASLEYANSEEIIRDGCLSRRLGEKLEYELGIPMKKQYSNDEHRVADVEHGKLLIQIADEYGDTPEALNTIRSGVTKSLAIDRVFRNFLGELLEKYAD